MKISAVVLTKNEEKNIKGCLESLRWCDEIIVIDSDSTDKTVEIAEKSGAKVFIHPLDNDFSKQRNFGLSKAEEEWVLFVDADERISDALSFEISGSIVQTANQEHYDGFYLKRADYLWEKELKHGETAAIKILRLAKRESGEWMGRVHEVWQIEGKKGTLRNPIKHYPHQTLDEFLKELNFYTDIRATELYEKKVKSYWWTVVLYPSGKFILNYFFKKGFMDGIEGLILATIMSMHSFLVRGKLWLLWQKK